MYLFEYLTTIKKIYVPMTNDGFILNLKKMLIQEIGFYIPQFSTTFQTSMSSFLYIIIQDFK